MIVKFEGIQTERIKGEVEKKWVQTNKWEDGSGIFPLLGQDGERLCLIKGRHGYEADVKGMLTDRGYDEVADFNCIWIQTMPPVLKLYCRDAISKDVLDILRDEMGLNVGVIKRWDNHYQLEGKEMIVMKHESITQCFMKLCEEDVDCVAVDLEFELSDDAKVVVDGSERWKLELILDSGMRADGYGDFREDCVIESKSWVSMGNFAEVPVKKFTSEFPLRDMIYNVYTFYFPTKVAKFSGYHYRADDGSRRKMFQEKYEY